jgi:hypothetical protein
MLSGLHAYQILRFQVSVADIEPVAVVDSANYLLEVVEGFVFGEPAATDQIFE